MSFIWIVGDPYFRLSWGIFLLYIGYSIVRNTEQRVLSEGIVNGNSVTSWDNFEGFELTDERLVLHVDGWNRERREFPLDEIADVRTVTYALSQYLGPAKKEHV